jgi:hypothetical protein
MFVTFNRRNLAETSKVWVSNGAVESQNEDMACKSKPKYIHQRKSQAGAPNIRELTCRPGFA